MAVLRRVVFYVFLVIYLTACPLTILYAFGYTYHPGAERGIVKTGLLYLSTNPPGASIYLGRRRFTKETPTSLPGLLPGEYPVRLLLKGHTVWEQTLPVEAEKATVVDKILLLPTRLKPHVALWGPFEQLIPLQGDKRLLLTTGVHLGDVVVYDTRSNLTQPLVPPRSDLHEAKIVSWFLVKDSPRLLVRAEDGDGRRWLWVELGRGEATLTDLTTLFLERPTHVEWEPRSRRYLFSVQEGSVNRVDAVDHAVSPKWLEGVAGFGVAGRAIYLVTGDGRLLRTDGDGRNAELLAELPLSDPPWLGPRPFHHVKALTPEVILTLSESGELLAARVPYRLVDAGVLGLEWDAHHQRVLCWQSNRIGLIEFDVEEWEAGEPEPAPQLQWVYEGGTRIVEAWWVYEGSHILFRDGDRLFLLELEAYGPPRLSPLLDVKRDSAMVYAEDSGRVYYLDPAGAQLSSLQVVPKRERLSLPPLEATARRKTARPPQP